MSSHALVSLPSPIIPAVAIPALPIEVGTLPDGTLFMSGRELARACGISNSTLVGWGDRSPQLGDRYRAGKLAELLATYQYQGDRLFIRLPDGSQFSGRANVSAYPYQVCLAFLDYYAFTAHKPAARDSLRLLSEQQLPQFTYKTVSGVLANAVPPKTPSPQQQPITPLAKCPRRNGVPVGYFNIEQIGEDTARKSLPVLSSASFSMSLVVNIAKAWSRYWTIQGLGQQYGDRLALPLKSVPTWSQPWQYTYPKAAWEAFQRWLEWDYSLDRFPSYQQRRRDQHLEASAPLQPLPPVVFNLTEALSDCTLITRDRSPSGKANQLKISVADNVRPISDKVDSSSAS